MCVCVCGAFIHVSLCVVCVCGLGLVVCVVMCMCGWLYVEFLSHVWFSCVALSVGICITVCGCVSVALSVWSLLHVLYPADPPGGVA